MVTTLDKRFDKKRIFRKYYALIIFAVMVLCIFIAQSLVANAQADGIETVESGVNYIVSTLNVTEFSYMTKIYNACTEFMQASGSQGGAAQFLHGAQGLIRGIACGMVLIFMLMNIIKETMRGEEMNMEAWLRVFVQMAAAYVLIFAIDALANAIMSLGGYIVTNINNAIQAQMELIPDISVGDSDSVGRFVAALENVNHPGARSIYEVMTANTQTAMRASWSTIRQATSMLEIMKYVVLIPLLVGAFMMYSAMFELKLREIFAPMAIASISYEGARSAGVRFIKKFLACFIKIAIYFVLAGLGTYMTYYFYQLFLLEGTQATPGDNMAALYMVMMFLGNVVAGLAMMQTGGLADEIVGV